MNSIITRFAPSPTGNLHIGSVRTALINYIITTQAKNHYPNSKFLLRIEDTDKKRSSIKFQDNIISGLKWLGISYDNEPFIQSSKIDRHKKIALDLINKKKAFKCICSPEFLDKRRQENIQKKNINKKLCNICENNTEIQSLKNNFVVRIKTPLHGETLINDTIQGKVKVNNSEIDDFILLRKDGTPTYMLSVVVDDFDMGVNFIIRGNDHLNNAFRQIFIYTNMEWPIPKYAHLPLIHGNDGKKLSKRHGSVDVQDFKDRGYLKQGIINNLILLGWSAKKINEFIEIDEVLKKFEIRNLSKSSSIFSYNKLNFFNNHYIKQDKDNKNFIDYCRVNLNLTEYLTTDREKLLKIVLVYNKNISYFKEYEKICPIYYNLNYKTKMNKLLNNEFNILINEFLIILIKFEKWDLYNLEKIIKNFINIKNIKFSFFGKPTRLLLINSENGPSISDILFILGKKNSIHRLNNYIIDNHYG